MLKLTLTHAGACCRIELDGVDISRYLTGVHVDASVGAITTATLRYSGAVLVEGEAGRLTLEQAPHYVECVACGKALAGEHVEQPHVIETTTLGDAYESQAPVQEQA